MPLFHLIKKQQNMHICPGESNKQTGQTSSMQVDTVKSHVNCDGWSNAIWIGVLRRFRATPFIPYHVIIVFQHQLQKEKLHNKASLCEE